ncbi:MAG: hypothetical protein JJLCMIEE_01063 [Acidimicrobiales bacterium]|nr:hypothetical protein [Acidimicrobiales bacterium]
MRLVLLGREPGAIDPLLVDRTLGPQLHEPVGGDAPDGPRSGELDRYRIELTGAECHRRGVIHRRLLVGDLRPAVQHRRPVDHHAGLAVMHRAELVAAGLGHLDEALPAGQPLPGLQLRVRAAGERPDERHRRIAAPDHHVVVEGLVVVAVVEVAAGKVRLGQRRLRVIRGPDSERALHRRELRAGPARGHVPGRQVHTVGPRRVGRRVRRVPVHHERAGGQRPHRRGLLIGGVGPPGVGNAVLEGLSRRRPRGVVYPARVQHQPVLELAGRAPHPEPVLHRIPIRVSNRVNLQGRHLQQVGSVLGGGVNRRRRAGLVCHRQHRGARVGVLTRAERPPRQRITLVGGAQSEPEVGSGVACRRCHVGLGALEPAPRVAGHVPGVEPQGARRQRHHGAALHPVRVDDGLVVPSGGRREVLEQALDLDRALVAGVGVGVVHHEVGVGDEELPRRRAGRQVGEGHESARRGVRGVVAHVQHIRGPARGGWQVLLHVGVVAVVSRRARPGRIDRHREHPGRVAEPARVERHLEDRGRGVLAGNRRGDRAEGTHPVAHRSGIVGDARAEHAHHHAVCTHELDVSREPGGGLHVACHHPRGKLHHHSIRRRPLR